MVNIRKFETEKEKNNRERRENIVKDYLGYAEQILQKEVAPGRVFKYLASQYNMTEYGIGSILKRYGVYESAANPVVLENVDKDIHPYPCATPTGSNIPMM